MRNLILTLTPALLSIVISCSSNKYEEAADELQTSADTVGTSLSQDKPLLSKTAHINFKTNNVYQTAQQVHKLATSLNGMVMNSDIQTEEENSKLLSLSHDSLQSISTYRVKAEMLVRVPAENLEVFMQQIGNQATVIHKSSLAIEDKSFEYLSARMKQQNRADFVSDANSKKTKVSESVTVLDEKDKAVDLAIANKRVIADLQYSTVQLNFFQNSVLRKETMANTDLADYQMPFFKSLKDAFLDGWKYFLNLILILTHLWTFIALVLIIYFGYRKLRALKPIV